MFLGQMTRKQITWLDRPRLQIGTHNIVQTYRTLVIFSFYFFSVYEMISFLLDYFTPRKIVPIFVSTEKNDPNCFYFAVDRLLSTSSFELWIFVLYRLRYKQKKIQLGIFPRPG